MRGMILIAVVFIFFCVRFYMLGRASHDVTLKLGVINGNLLTCGNKPNCVSSTDARLSHRILPVNFKDSAAEMKQKLLKAFSKMGNFTVVTEKENYIHAIYTSTLFGFVDDVEFYFPEKQLFMRSESRVGHSDFSANRRRLEAISKMVK